MKPVAPSLFEARRVVATQILGKGLVWSRVFHMLITVVIHDFSKNGFVRAYPILKVLQLKHEIQLLGFCFEKQAFPIYLNEFEHKIVYTKKHLLHFIKDFWKVFFSIKGDVIYAFKPRVPSFFTALLHKLIFRTPIILDNEDWEGEHYFTTPGLIPKLKIWREKNIFSVENPIYRGLLEYLIPFANQVTVVSSFLQKRSGGTLLLHGADKNVFNPDLHDKNELKRKYRLSKVKTIVFTGTVFPHKGLSELMDAINSLGKTLRIKLVIAGVKNKHVEELIEKWGEQILFLGPLPHRKMPEVLALADAVVLAQKNTLHAQAQVPAKLFEAMAMNVPIVASKISDIPIILGDDCYYIEDYAAISIAAQLKKCLLDNKSSTQIAQSARKKFLANYTYESMDRILSDVLCKAIQSKRSRKNLNTFS